MPSLTREQALKVLAQLEAPHFVPFLSLAAALQGVPKADAERAYEAGLSGHGTDLEVTFAATVEKAKARFILKALEEINAPGISRSDEPRARQLLQILARLDRDTFGNAAPKTKAVAPAHVKPRSDKRQLDISALEKPE